MMVWSMLPFKSTPNFYQSRECWNHLERETLLVCMTLFHWEVVQLSKKYKKLLLNQRAINILGGWESAVAVTLHRCQCPPHNGTSTISALLVTKGAVEVWSMLPFKSTPNFYQIRECWNHSEKETLLVRMKLFHLHVIQLSKSTKACAKYRSC